MGQIEVFSPAKINLFLSVVARMDSGYHELVSLVAPIDFGDSLHVETKPGDGSVELECDDPTLPSGDQNLAFRAARLFLDHFGSKVSVRVRLTKRIPQGAGLGGGSSNAAAVLSGLAQLLGKNGDRATLLALAAELGSDCPLFLHGEPLVMRGRGEQLEALGLASRQRLSGRRVLVFKPSFAISTRWAYGALANGGSHYDDRVWADTRIAQWADGHIDLALLLHNSFQPVADRKYPALELLRRRLAAAGFVSLMSGSGSACFALLDDDEGELALREIIREAWGKHAFVQSAKVL